MTNTKIHILFFFETVCTKNKRAYTEIQCSQRYNNKILYGIQTKNVEIIIFTKRMISSERSYLSIYTESRETFSHNEELTKGIAPT